MENPLLSEPALPAQPGLPAAGDLGDAPDQEPQPGLPAAGDPSDEGEQSDQERFVVVTPDGVAVTGATDADANPASLIEQPAKVMRIGSMIKQLLEEVKSAPLDEAGRARLASIHERSLVELEKGLAPELVEELRSMALPFEDGSTPSDAELRIAQAQLVGWLEGLFSGIQTVLFAQQMAARAQLEQMRRALPGTAPGFSPGAGPGLPGEPPGPSVPGSGTGQYL